ncbi:uncharacterized protein LOC109432633 [Aedes albopictus]|uniref:ZAD domain-containing protein n=1 Tax=Aedes albopictus TaxID=7160 RepID=A0ABM1Z0G2_AEDAL
MSGESPPMELCRTCCKPQDPAVKHTMLVPVAATGQQSGLTISEMIYQLTEILVTLEPLLPQHICTDCVVSLEAAHGFRQMTINSNTVLLDRRDQQKQLEESEANPDDDGEMLVIKEETFDVDLDTEDSNLYSLLEQEVYGETVPEKKKKPSVRKSTRKRKRCQTLAEIVMKECVERRGDRYFCIADPNSNCQRSTTLYGWDVGNTIRHCRAMHKAVALAHGLFKEPDQPQSSSVAKSKSKPKPDRQAPKQKLGASEQKKRTFRRIARECMHKKEGRFVCAITGDSTDCTYNQRALDMGNFIRHFRVRHTDLALAKGLLKPEEKLLMEMKQARIKIATQATKLIVREIRQEKG